MKKSHLILIVLLLMVVGYAATQMKIDIKGNTTLSENTSDFNVYLANLKLNGTEIEGINGTKDKYEINVPSKGTLEYDVINDSTEYDVEAIVECEEKTGIDTVMDIPYTGKESVFYIQKNGTYKLETWGAQGGSSTIAQGGYGSYSVGNVLLNKDDKLYINIGGAGLYRKVNQSPYTITGGYNGGGTAYDSSEKENRSSGGGATHIATISGQLSSLSSSVGKIMIVSGGGGGSTGSAGGAAGGIKGVMGAPISGYTIGTGGTQTSGGVCSNSNKYSCTSSLNGSFGKGGNSIRSSDNTTYGGSGGGGGFYGGAAGYDNGAGSGGSGYIGNSSLTEKTMYCYNCQESKNESTKTISTTCVNSTPTENCAKSGNGYARITQISPIVSSIQLETTTIEAQDKLNKSVEVSNNGMTCSLKIKKISRTEKKVYDGPTEWTFDYTGGEQTFTVPLNGTYKLETWGAQGANYNTSLGAGGGSGGYSVGMINLSKKTSLYINIGGSGGEKCLTESCSPGGYNGGGIGSGNTTYSVASTGGGGATHIALSTGVLSSLENKIKDILIVSGGGGGTSYQGDSNGAYTGHGGHGGGFKGSNGTNKRTGWNPGYGGTQTSGGASGGGNKVNGENRGDAGTFGQGGNGIHYSGGGGGGFYGGGASNQSGAGGGSGYIGNTLLTDKSMYCYNCTESTDESIKTISTTCTSATPTENCAKSGNGYARITLIK